MVFIHTVSSALIDRVLGGERASQRRGDYWDGCFWGKLERGGRDPQVFPGRIANLF